MAHEAVVYFMYAPPSVKLVLLFCAIIVFVLLSGCFLMFRLLFEQVCFSVVASFPDLVLCKGAIFVSHCLLALVMAFEAVWCK